MRDRTTTREDFIFFTDRLSTFLSEKALEYLPCAKKDVTTPVGATYAGKQLAVDVSAIVVFLRLHVLSSYVARLRSIYLAVVRAII